jgi:adenylosuccinate synthase
MLHQKLLKEKAKIGSTLKGIGPTYMDKTGRNGLRIGDIISDNFEEKYATLLHKHQDLLKQYDFEYDLSEFEKGWFEGIEVIKSFKIVDSEHFINNQLKAGKSVLAEGAQGTLLDIDFGSYPFVTSSNTICAGACTGLGVAPNRIGEVFGIFKAYCTRVGSGPFPTELHSETGELLRKQGNEFGATTGRARRCGWLDLPALKYSIMLNGVTKLIMMKADVLSGFDKIKIATAYKTAEGTTEEFPYELETITDVVYDELEGWSESDLEGIKTKADLPIPLKKYIKYIEDNTGVPITVISLGPNRDQTIEL